jgi:ribosome recycling factor
MSPNQIIDSFSTDAKVVVERLGSELKKIRTGRAHASMLDSVMISAYGAMMPLNQAANVTAPEAQLLQITPFDPSNIHAIADAIRNDASLGLNPTDDGRVVRVPIPALTTERRQQIAKQLGEKKEDCYVALRQARHDALDLAKKAKSDKAISEDDLARVEKQVDEHMNKLKLEIEAMAKAKDAEIMTV